MQVQQGHAQRMILEQGQIQPPRLPQRMIGMEQFQRLCALPFVLHS